MMSLRSIARALGGDVVAGGVNAPGPGHTKRDRSLRVLLVDHAPGGIWIESFAGDDWKVCRDYVLGRLGIRETVKAPSTHLSPPNVPSTAHSDNSARALAIWNEAKPIGGTIAERYLESRSVDIAELPDMAHALRWHDRCPWEHGRHGCMVALFTDPVTGEQKAIHRTAIGPDGTKVDRMTFGPSKGCMIPLWPDEAVTTGLVIGEGIETLLSAATRIQHKGTKLPPAWAAGSAPNMAALPVLAGIEAITILVDHDASKAGHKAAAQCSARWTAAGCEVIRLTPKAIKTDFADIVARRAA